MLDSCQTPALGRCCDSGAFDWFQRMIPNCLEQAAAAHESGRPVVGILCEFTPRELILAAGALPVCLCGGSPETIAAAEEGLPASLCPLIKSTYGYHVGRSNHFLEMADLIVAETTCDGKKKMYELLSESRPMVILELPQMTDSADSLERWVWELRRLRNELEQRFGVPVTDDRVQQAIVTMNHERSLRRELAGLMRGDPPPMSGRRLLDLKSSISGQPALIEQLEHAYQRLSRQGPDGCLAGRVRVLLTGVPTVHGAERVVELIEDSGGVVVCMENCTGLKPILEDVASDASDPIRALAEKYYHLPCSVMSPNERRLESLRQLAAEYRPHCIIELVWQGCLTYDVESWRVKRLAERELKLAYLKIVTDYSPSDSARLALRIEALYETARGRHRSAVLKP